MGYLPGERQPQPGLLREPNSHFSPGNDVKNGYAEPSWANGGSKPNVIPWVAIPQVGLRFKPVKQFEGRLSLGLALTGFWFGFSGSYGFERPIARGPELAPPPPPPAR